MPRAKKQKAIIVVSEAPDNKVNCTIRFVPPLKDAEKATKNNAVMVAADTWTHLQKSFERSKIITFDDSRAKTTERTIITLPEKKVISTD